MRCKKHFSVDDVSSNVGVCACCLRERLRSLIDSPSSWAHHPYPEQQQQQPKHHPSPLLLPRSVSPYTSPHNKQREMRFFSTPQAGPTAATAKKKSKFNAISSFFRSKSAKSAHFSSDPFSGPIISDSNQSQKPMSAFIYPSAGDRKKTTLKLFTIGKASDFDDRRGNRNRGMSPEKGDDSYSESLSPSGYSPERWKRTPLTRPGHGRAKASPARSNVVKSGMGICLSPLMRPSPKRQWSGKGVGPGGGMEAVYSGEVRSTVKPHLSTAASFCSNRSRKLADFGKFDRNR